MQNAEAEFEQLPKNPARDFFLRQVCFDDYLEGVDVSSQAQIRREFHQLAYLLNIRTLQMKLDRNDWKTISRVMLSIVGTSL